MPSTGVAPIGSQALYLEKAPINFKDKAA